MISFLWWIRSFEKNNIHVFNMWSKFRENFPNKANINTIIYYTMLLQSNKFAQVGTKNPNDKLCFRNHFDSLIPIFQSILFSFVWLLHQRFLFSHKNVIKKNYSYTKYIKELSSEYQITYEARAREREQNFQLWKFVNNLIYYLVHCQGFYERMNVQWMYDIKYK